MIEPGKVLQQRYRVDKQIGQGGMGSVYVATDERFGSTVAIKETLCMDDNFRKALEREARLLNSLKHVALPRVSDHFIEENGQFLVMEYIPGDDLAVILEQNLGPFEFERVLKWSKQLLDALEFLHGQSMPVIHRDIKPQNLKLTAQDQIVLLDFGLAKGNPTDAGGQTAAKSIFGYSRNYASLEQIQGTGTDPRSDLYSLAATLYHLATGQPPEDALTRAMTVLSHQPDPLPAANAVNPDIPAGFAGVLRSALDLNAAFRPASAAEMRSMLDDMDSYAHLAEGAAAPTAASVDLGSQKTKLMPGLTNQAANPQTGVKTEILPSYISQETALRPERRGVMTDPERAADPGSRGRFAAIAGAALLLLLCGLTAGSYLFKPSLFSTSPESTDPQATVPSAEQPEANSAPDTAEQQVEAPPADIAPQPKEQPARADADKGSSRQQGARGERRAEVDELPKMEISGPEDNPTVKIGNMTIKDGKIETPDEIIDEDGVKPKRRRAPKVGVDVIPDLRYLKPDQRRKLIELRRKGIVPPIPNHPADPPEN